MPNLIEVQKDSYQWFLDEGMKEVFEDISPIADYSGKLSLEFVDFTLCEDDVKYSIEECKERDATFAAPLKARVRLHVYLIHISEPTRLLSISYAVFCLKKKKKI